MGKGGSKGLNAPAGRFGYIAWAPFSGSGRGPNSPKPGGPLAKMRSKSNTGMPCGKGSATMGWAIGT